MTRRKAEPDAANGAGTPLTPGEGSADQVLLRSLPSVDELVRRLQTETPALTVSHDALVRAARAVIEATRRQIRAGSSMTNTDDLVVRLRERLSTAQALTLRPVINATGVIVNTN
ncbi:MAG: hypothetical protein ACRDHE_05570, partial [Ktedonobacterales bacterium]